LPIKDVDFYCTMDNFYWGFDLETGEKTGTRVDMHAGGVTDLLNVIGHYEKELTLGTLAQTRDALGIFIQPDELGCPHLAIDSYYQVLGGPERVTLDAALDRFQALDLQELSFWLNYARRVQKALAEEFYEVVEIPTKVKRKDVPQFKPYLTTFAEL